MLPADPVGARSPGVSAEAIARFAPNADPPMSPESRTSLAKTLNAIAVMHADLASQARERTPERLRGEALSMLHATAAVAVEKDGFISAALLGMIAAYLNK